MNESFSGWRYSTPLASVAACSSLSGRLPVGLSSSPCLGVPLWHGTDGFRPTRGWREADRARTRWTSSATPGYGGESWGE